MKLKNKILLGMGIVAILIGLATFYFNIFVSFAPFALFVFGGIGIIISFIED